MYGFARNHLGRLSIPEAVPSPQLQKVGWVPTNEKEAEKWVIEQAEMWAAPAIQQKIGEIKSKVSAELSSELEIKNPLTENESLDWALDYATRKGFPTTPEEGMQMMRAFLNEQGSTIGVHPAFIAASDLLIDFPLNDPQKALEWTVNVAGAFTQQWGIPLTTDFDTKSIVLVSAQAALTHANVPFAGAMVMSADVLWDGKVSKSEISSIAGVVGSIVGAAVGQMFGIPAPIGAFVGSVVTTLIFEGLGQLFGWNEDAKKKRDLAYAAALEAAKAREVQCIQMGFQAWTQYQNFWHKLASGLQADMDAQSEWLSEGLRYFETVHIEEVEADLSKCPEQVGAFMGQRIAAGMGRGAAPTVPVCYVPLPKIIDQFCENPAGCIYWPEGPAQFNIWKRYNERGFFGEPGHTHPDEMPEVNLETIELGGKINGRLDARAALAWYGAYEFVTPYHAYRTLVHGGGHPHKFGMDVRSLLPYGEAGVLNPEYESELHTDREYIEFLAQTHIERTGRQWKAEDLEIGGCRIQAVAKSMFDSLVQCGPAAALVQRDITGSVVAAMTKYRIQREMAVETGAQKLAQIQRLAAKTAQTQRDMLVMRRRKERNTMALNGGLLAGGAGALAGWGLGGMVR